MELAKDQFKRPYTTVKLMLKSFQKSKLSPIYDINRDKKNILRKAYCLLIADWWWTKSGFFTGFL